MLYINGNPLNNLEVKHYLIIRMERNIWTGKYKYHVDAGQPEDKNSELTDEKGNAITFASEVDVMNYLYFEGWNHKMTYLATNPSTGAHIHRILFTKSS